MKGKERFLLWFLAAIIGSQIIFLAMGARYCAMNGGLDACPEIAKRWETTYGVAIATVLALLTGSALTTRPSLGDRDDASVLPPPLQLQQPTPGNSSGVPGRGQGSAQEKDSPASPSGPASGRASRKG